MKLSCGTTEAALQAARVQDELMASQLRAAKHALECEKDETQALRQQASLRSANPPQICRITPSTLTGHKYKGLALVCKYLHCLPFLLQ